MPAPAQATRPATQPDPAAGVIDDVFLTPRVLDRRAFDDYTESLKSLIRDASGESHTLSRTAADVRILRDQLASAATEAQKRLDAALKAIAAIEQRAPELAGAAPPEPQAGPAPAAPARKGSRTRPPEPIAHQAAPAAPPISADLLRALESRLLARLEAEVETRVEGRIRALADPLIRPLVADAVGSAIPTALDQHLPSITDRVTSALERSLADRTALLERSLEAASRRFTAETGEQATRVAADAKAAIESARAECEAAVRQITTGASLRVRRAQQDADAALAALDAKAAERLDTARADFNRMLEALTAESSDRAQWIRAALAELTGPRIDALRTLVGQAAAHADPAADASLAGALARAESLKSGVETNLVQIEELSKQVGLMRDLLARSILEGVGRIDDLDARQEELLASASRALEQYAREVDSHRAGMAAPHPGSAQAPSRADAPDAAALAADLAAAQDRLDALRRQNDEATHTAEWLTALIDRAARAGIALDEPRA